ncbi:50S ribosomal protein L25 [bacterium]|nr:50S ribosomal protein L25 [bacterium]
MIKLVAKIRKKEEDPKEIRQSGFCPAILYGPKRENLLLKVPQKDFSLVLKEAGTTQFVDLFFEGEKEPLSVLIKDVSRHYLTGKVIHIDFYQPDLTKTIETLVPLEFVGSAPAERKGGVLIKNLKEIEVESLPKKLPKSIPVDLSSLTEFDSKILVKDIKFPEGVRPLISLETVIVSIGEAGREEIVEEGAKEEVGQVEKETAGSEEEKKEE